MFTKLITRQSSSLIGGLGRRRRRWMSTSLKATMAEVIPKWRVDYKDVRTRLGKEQIDTVTVDQVLGGMRGITAMVYDTSLLDAEDGIEFRGHTIPELMQVLPKASGSEYPLAEGLLWLLLTGRVPTAAEVNELVADLRARRVLPPHVKHILNNLPKEMHPMTQLTTGVLALQTESQFARLYAEGKINKLNAWESTLEDSLNCIARLPQVAAIIYRNKFKNGNHLSIDGNLDWAASLAALMGVEDPAFRDLMRIYMTIHSDHEGGNVSAHATHLIGSALSDPYLSLAGGLTGLAGPLHGLANQEVLVWIMKMRAEIGSANPTKEQITDYCWKTLKAGKVIPGYGHAVLRKTDPRYTCQREFALKHLPDDPLFKLVRDMYEVVPGILTEHGKTKNPWPNVDAHSGVLLQHYGVVEADFYTVLFGVSRAMGVLSQLVVSRGIGLPIERPKSLTLDAIKKHFDTIKK